MSTHYHHWKKAKRVYFANVASRYPPTGCTSILDISGAILFIWASVVDLYNRLKPGLSPAELIGEEEGGWLTLDLNYLDHYLAPLWPKKKSLTRILGPCVSGLVGNQHTAAIPRRHTVYEAWTISAHRLPFTDMILIHPYHLHNFIKSC